VRHTLLLGRAVHPRELQRQTFSSRAEFFDAWMRDFMGDRS
jgi:hypothetical protein